MSKTIHLPHLDDLRAMLKLACRMYELDAAKRPAHLLDGMRELLNADNAIAWTLDPTGQSTAAFARMGTRAAPPQVDHDPAAALLARSQRQRTPIVRFRAELVERELWRRTAHVTLRQSADSIYSLHHVHESRTLLSFYRDKGTDGWGPREQGIVHLLHAQSGWVFGPQA